MASKFGYAPISKWSIKRPAKESALGLFGTIKVALEYDKDPGLNRHLYEVFLSAAIIRREFSESSGSKSYKV
jgi:hypothetical protein